MAAQRYNLNRKLSLEAPIRTGDGAGGYVESWSTLGEIWAQITARSSSIGEGAGADLNRQRFRIVLRGAEQGSSLRPIAGQRFKDGARIFIVDAVSELGIEGHYLECWTHEETLS